MPSHKFLPCVTQESIPEEHQAPIKKLRKLVPPSALMEQLDSVLPAGGGAGERFQVALDLMHEWGRCGMLVMPDAVKMMYS